MNHAPTERAICDSCKLNYRIAFRAISAAPSPIHALPVGHQSIRLTMVPFPADDGFERLSLDTQYRTGERDPVEFFYRPCLSLAVCYARAVGYFRSSIFVIVGEPFLAFARRGGTVRLVCSPSITEEDANAIATGYAQRDDVIATALSRDIEALLADGALASRTKVLATLIKCGALDVRLAIRGNAAGIYHEKLGIFTDSADQRVSFVGSANETWSAWHADGNHESIEVFREWVNDVEAARVQGHAAHFERLWEGKVAGVDTISFPEAQRKQLLTVAEASIDDIAWAAPSRHIPRRAPLPHQLAAIEAWENAGCRGIFEHATGSGKTFTAIIAIRRHLALGKPALVLVPSQLLLDQWREEIEQEIPEATLLVAGGGNSKWNVRGRLRSHTSSAIDVQRIVVATMQTAATEAFLREIRGGPHLLFVADEVHQLGSPFNARAMLIESGASLGLSATPVRAGDAEGTARIIDRFGPIILPTITLNDAIKSGRLVEYEYHPHPVHLDEQEAGEWKKLTCQISLEVARSVKDDAGLRRLTDKARMLLIRRTRIAKKAKVKPGLVAGIIARGFSAGQSWLVYCEDSAQLGETMARLVDLGLRPIEYHTGMSGDRNAAMEWFRKFGGVLVSIKCLDEGVDIPAVSHAFILASSQNPRQFIQRRGRVLRKSPGKDLAVIHDAIVIPVDGNDEPEQISLLKSELARALQFADSALNRGAGAQLRAIAISMNVDIEHAAVGGIEDEENE